MQFHEFLKVENSGNSGNSSIWNDIKRFRDYLEIFALLFSSKTNPFIFPKKNLWPKKKTMKKYVGVQSWKATHLSTLDIRVEQKGSLVMKKEKLWKTVRAQISAQIISEKG